MIAGQHGFTAVSLWEPVNAGRPFEDLRPDEVAVRVQDAKGRTLEITAGELRARETGEEGKCQRTGS